MDGNLLDGDINIVDPNYFVKSLWDDPDCSNMVSNLTDADMSNVSHTGLRRLSGLSNILEDADVSIQSSNSFANAVLKFRNSVDNSEKLRQAVIEEVLDDKAQEGLPEQFTRSVALSANPSADATVTVVNGSFNAPIGSTINKTPTASAPKRAASKVQAAQAQQAAQVQAQQAVQAQVQVQAAQVQAQQAAQAQAIAAQQAQMLAILQQQQAQMQQQMVAAMQQQQMAQQQHATTSGQSEPASPENQGEDDGGGAPDRITRRRQQKREYSRSYRVQQKSYVGQLEGELGQTKLALQFLQNVHLQLQVQHAQLAQSQQQQQQQQQQAEGQQPSPDVEVLKATVDELRNEVQSQKDKVNSREAMIHKMLNLFNPNVKTSELSSIEEAVAAALAAPFPVVIKKEKVEASNKSGSAGGPGDFSMKSNADQSMKSNPDCSGSSVGSRRSSWGRQCRSWMRNKPGSSSSAT
jgi:hypothetical protein